MQNNQNLWIGLLIGNGLTGLLMYILSQQAGLFNTAPTATKTTPTMTTPFVKPELPGSAQTESTKPKTVEPEITRKQPVASQQATQAPPATPIKKPVKPRNIDLPGLPENPRLPEKELAKLSQEEREKYEKVLTTYQQVRDKVLRLHQEREQLEQQINRIIEENTTVDRQLDKMKENQKTK